VFVLVKIKILYVKKVPLSIKSSFGDIRFQLEKRGKLIGPFDMLIAAHALSQDLIMVTNNDKEFRRIKNLEVENWTK